jgi:RIO kinase 1
MRRSTSYGRKEQETAWKNSEVEALYQLADVGVRVPAPYGYFNGVLVMELVTGADGGSAPNLSEVELSAEQARDYHRFLIGQIVRMLCAGLIHGDLSEYNILVAADSPVIIDLPQVVSASGNNNAQAMLARDVNNVTATLSRFAPELLVTRFAEEMWALYEQGLLRPDSVLSGEFVSSEIEADVAATLLAIEDARDEALRRQRGREAAEAG